MKCAEVEIHDPQGRAIRSVLRHELGRAQDRMERLDPHDMRDPGKDQLKDKRIRAIANGDTHLHEARGYLHLAQLPMAVQEATWALAWLEIGYACACGDDSKKIALEVKAAGKFLHKQVAEALKDLPTSKPSMEPAQGKEEGSAVERVLARLAKDLTAPTQGQRLSEPMPISQQAREAAEEERKEREAIRSEAANPGHWSETEGQETETA